MSKFYFLLWLKWVIRLTAGSVVGSFLLSLFVVIYVYLNNDMQSLNTEITKALFLVFKFWFALLWNFTLLVTLFRSLKHPFNQCYDGYQMKLLTCVKKDEGMYIKDVLYGDLIRVWRKWLMLIIWIVAIEMIVAVVISKVFSSYSAVFDWFNVYILYFFILVAGYFSFMLLASRCKLVKIKKC